MTTNELFEKLKSIAEEVAKEESLPLKSIERAPRGNVLGLCSYDGDIKIKMRTTVSLDERNRILENARTVCHELAHLKEFHHGPEFWEYQKEICKKFSEKLGSVVIPERSMVR